MNVSVIGAGIMGSGIGQVLALADCNVVLCDVNETILARALSKIEHGRFGIRRAIELGKLAESDAVEALDRIKTTTDLAAAAITADMVIEAVPEVYETKIGIFQQLDRIAPASTIFASNTAGLSISAIACATQRPQRVIGWHWAQPCSVMKFAEIIVHPTIDPQTTEAVISLAKKAGKNPVVVRDQPFVWGFVANRISAAIRREAAAIVAEQIATKEDVDTLMRDAFRWPMGPFELMENVVDK